MKINRTIGVLLVSALLFLLSACSSSIMVPTANMAAPDSNYALVSFVRPTFFGGAILFSLWDSEEFVGVLTAGSMVQYKAKPGEHIFLARGENWSYVKANLQAGRQYVIEGKVFPGAWKARVGLAPINVNEPGYLDKAQDWLKNLKPTTAKPELVDSYVKPRLSQVKEALADFPDKVKYADMEPGFGF